MNTNNTATVASVSPFSAKVYKAFVATVVALLHDGDKHTHSLPAEKLLQRDELKDVAGCDFQQYSGTAHDMLRAAVEKGELTYNGKAGRASGYRIPGLSLRESTKTSDGLSDEVRDLVRARLALGFSDLNTKEIGSSWLMGGIPNVTPTAQDLLEKQIRKAIKSGEFPGFAIQEGSRSTVVRAPIADAVPAAA